MPRRTKDEAEQTRARIMDAAEKVFYDQGVARTSLEEVARAAAVTRGAVYWHFKDKIELLDALTRRVFLPHEDVLDKLAARHSDQPLDALETACAETLRSMGRDRRRRKVVSILMFRCEYVKEMAAILKRRHACKDRMLARTLAMMNQASERGHLSPAWTPRLAALGLEAVMGGLITNALEGRKDHDLIKAAPLCLHAFFQSLKR